ncbi:unnamed protein product [Polarella glacialis]|uniref:TLC domain-containing protein n=1 Tax=Polarella glacialis TaxID=89957 RepID=A0A813J5J9_POLGL|nr:unnamed protein product [Polarella glacialis]
MVPKCFGSEAAFRASYTYDLSAYKGGQDELWLEHVIFSSLFGFMVRDFFLHWRRPDPLLTVHHILVCFLMVSVCFLPVPGFRILAFITPVVEIGSSAYCLWCVRGWRTLYVVLMTLSNVLWILGASACTFLPPFSKLQLLLWAVGVSMACGRQLFLARELFGSAS